MAEFSLTAAPPLAGVDEKFDGIHLRAPKDLAIVAVALPLGGEDAALTAIRKGYGADLPAPGKSVSAKEDGATLLRLAPDQAFILFHRAEPDAEAVVAEGIGDTAYLTDQTDVWCGLEVSGPRARIALERICPIDIHADAFAVGDAARTVMEHLGTIIIRTEQDTFLLLSASSSAGSFLHAVETSIRNVS